MFKTSQCGRFFNVQTTHILRTIKEYYQFWPVVDKLLLTHTTYNSKWKFLACGLHVRIQKVLSDGFQLWQRFFNGERREDPNTNIGPPAKRHCRWWPNIECWLGSLVNFQGMRTSIARKPYIFVIFQRGSGPSCLPPLWIRPWTLG